MTISLILVVTVPDTLPLGNVQVSNCDESGKPCERRKKAIKMNNEVVELSNSLCRQILGIGTDQFTQSQSLS